MDSIDEIIHKEKSLIKKENNKTKGQVDKLFRVSNNQPMSRPILPIDDNKGKADKVRDSFNKNDRIDLLLEQLMNSNLLMEDYYSFYAKCIHTLGVSFVRTQMVIAVEQGKNPQALFHWLINRAMDKKQKENTATLE